jgi:hypothetical protein
MFFFGVPFGKHRLITQFYKPLHGQQTRKPSKMGGRCQQLVKPADAWGSSFMGFDRVIL